MEALKNALLTVTENVSRYHQAGARPPYLVWSEEGGRTGLWADNRPDADKARGSVHYFTLEENDGGRERVEAAFLSVGASFYLNSVQYEKDTGLIHFEWVWELV